MADRYSYPDSMVLINKLGITTAEQLLEAEIDIASKRLLELQRKPVKGKFDFKHLCAIHRRIFQDIYSWAGKTRTVDIGKGNIFCFVQNIPSYAASVFEHYYEDCRAARDDKQKFVHVLTQYYGDVNALHPFREGNGRAQREFTRELCSACGYDFDLTQTTHEEMLHASIASFHGDNKELETIFLRCIAPVGDF